MEEVPGEYCSYDCYHYNHSECEGYRLDSKSTIELTGGKVPSGMDMVPDGRVIEAYGFKSRCVNARPCYPLTAPESGVKQVAHSVAEHVKTVNGNSQGKTGIKSQPWRHLHVSTPFPTEHTSPTRKIDW